MAISLNKELFNQKFKNLYLSVTKEVNLNKIKVNRKELEPTYIRPMVNQLDNDGKKIPILDEKEEPTGKYLMMADSTTEELLPAWQVRYILETYLSKESKDSGMGPMTMDTCMIILKPDQVADTFIHIWNKVKADNPGSKDIN